MNPLETYMRVMRPFLTPSILMMERTARALKEVGLSKFTQEGPDPSSEAQQTTTAHNGAAPQLTDDGTRQEPDEDSETADSKRAAAQKRATKARKTRRANAILEKDRMAARRKSRSNHQRAARRTARA